MYTPTHTPDSKSVNKPSDLQAKTYKSMMSTYDGMEKILKVFNSHGPAAEPYIKHLQKLIDTIEKNNEIMLDNFFKYMQSGKQLSGMEKMKIEKSVNESKMALQQFLNKVTDK